MQTTFITTVELAGKTATGVEVPAASVAALGSQRQPLVRVTIGGHTYRSKVAVRGNRFLLPISADNRAAAGVAAGDEITVTLALDDAPREVEVPDDLAAALAAAPPAEATFASLSYSRRRWFVEDVLRAKQPATRQRRIEKAVVALTS
jgi:hypothetical protein